MSKSAVIVDFRMPEQMREKIRQCGAAVLPSVALPSVAQPLCGHPDIQICFSAPGCAVCAPEVFCYYKPLLQPFGVRVVCGKTRLDRNYPADIAYTVAGVGRYAITLVKQTDPVLLQELERSGKQPLGVSQGYAKCNVCVVREQSIITSDAGIAKAVETAGMDVLRICPGGIALPGYDYGFIGGASGLLPDGRVFFCGDITQHPDFLKIDAFFRARGAEYVFVPELPLTDFGSVLPVWAV